MYKPKVFIGSSSENLEVAEAIQANLMYKCCPEIWDESLTALSISTLSNLMKAVDKYDFAVLVLGGEDVAVIRREENIRVSRDNIIFELGLFMGKLGPERVYIVKPHSCQMHLPTDLLGITYGEYDEEHSNKKSALRPFCNTVISQIKQTVDIEFPEDGPKGSNILVEVGPFGSVDLKGLYDVHYGMYAKTNSHQELKVIIENTSKDQISKWYYDKTSMRGWFVDEYKNRKQQFSLDPSTRGILMIWFEGVGSARISLLLNGGLIKEKLIEWNVK